MAASEKKAPADFRGRLRLATRDAHLRLEDAVDFDGRITSLEAYRGFIEDFYRLVRPLEAMLGGLDLSMLPIDYPSRRKLPWIEADLKDLGHTDETLARLPDYPGIPPLAPPLEVLGALYVLEGSSLGRQAMLGALGARLGVRPDWCGHFFSGYGKRTGEMWRGFVAVLNEAGRSPEAAQVIENAALASFAAFEACLAEGRHKSETRAAQPGLRCPVGRNRET
ncbi:MAG: biliverdin-producing heme oxygenase [Rhodomicrobium sp.]